MAAGGKTEPKSLDKLSVRNVVSPYSLHKGVGSRKVYQWVRVEHRGESKSHPVMGWIGANALTRKCADFHVVAYHKIVWGISEGGNSK